MSDFNGQKIQENISLYRTPIYKVASQQLDQELSLSVVDDLLYEINSWPQTELEGAKLDSFVWKRVIELINIKRKD